MELYALTDAFYTRLAINPMSAGQIALWHALVRIANKSGWAEWVTIAGCTLGQHTGLSSTGIKKARNELKQRGLIDFKPNGTKATRYKVIDISKSVQVGVQKRDQVGVQTGDQIGASLTNNKQETNPPSAPKGERKPPAWEERFDRFWAAYPNKVGKDAARRAWAKRKPSEELLKRMLEALEAQRHTKKWTVEGGRFVPNPSTWLNQGRWEDEVQVAPESAEAAGAIPESWEAMYG